MSVDITNLRIAMAGGATMRGNAAIGNVSDGNVSDGNAVDRHAADRHAADRNAVVDGVTLHIGERERVGLIGESGSGKSLIARAMLGLLPPRAHCSGSIAYDGVEALSLTDRAMADLRGRYMGTVFQNPSSSLNPVLTAVQQVMLPLRLHYRLSKADMRDRALAALARVGLDGAVAARYPHQLSGGQRQRVAIATALVTSPRLIIADEPTTALDSIIQREIVDLLVSLVDGLGASMLFITHDFSVLAHATRRCYVLESGHVVEAGDTVHLLEHPQSGYTRRLVEAAAELTLHVGDVGDVGDAVRGEMQEHVNRDEVNDDHE